MKHTIDHRKPRSKRRPAYISCPVRVGEVIKTASGARQFSRGEVVTVYSGKKNFKGEYEWHRTTVAKRKRPPVANWSPEFVAEELAISQEQE